MLADTQDPMDINFLIDKGTGVKSTFLTPSRSKKNSKSFWRTLMNFFALSLSFCATLCLAAKSITFGSQSAYEFGCKLAEKERILSTRNDGKKISMEVNVPELIKVVDSGEMPKLFDIEYLKGRLSPYSKTIEFTEFRGILSSSSLNLEASIVADVAILKWIVHAIDNKVDGQVVRFKPYDLKIVCSLCLNPELGTDKQIIVGVTKVLNESVIFVQHLSTDSMKDFVDALITISNILQSHEISAELNEVLDAIVSLLAERENALENLELLAQLEAYEAYY